MTGILALVAILGIAWLVGVATNDGGEPVSSGTSATDGATTGGTGGTGGTGDATDTPGDATDASGHPTGGPTGTGGGGDDGRRPGDVSTPQASRNDRRSINWNGVRLDGSSGGPGCVTIINKTSTPGTIESVSFTVVSGPGRAVARSAPERCEPTGDPLCQGVRLKTGYQCLAGAIITGDASDSPYVIQAVVRFRYMCVDVENAPCDQVRDWRGLTPTAEAPVEVTGTTTNNVPRFEFYIGDSATSTPDGEGGSSTSPEASPDGTAPFSEATDTPAGDQDTGEEDTGIRDDGAGTPTDGTTGGDPAPTEEGE
ncbi:hypothetical protein [Streptosporangium sp. NPDC048865]|uniref:hypothetical protein n=1 Tax=Streptosporangium sp. NPDC048865 TaxID=3155766 RepID=UPI00342AB4CE